MFWVQSIVRPDPEVTCFRSNFGYATLHTIMSGFSSYELRSIDQS